MMTFNFSHMLLIHMLIGAGLTLFFALRDSKKGVTRNFFNFGNGILGEQRKWLQWYSWALGFEMLTSLFYIHTGMLYFELGMSLIEAIAVTVGAFIVDRLYDFFAGNVEYDIPKPKIVIHNPFEGMVDGLKGTLKMDNTKGPFKMNNSKSDIDRLQEKQNKQEEENKKFDDLIKGH